MRVDTQREKLTSQLSELEATERVLARYSKEKAASAMTPTSATNATTPARTRRRRRTTTAKTAVNKGSSPSLADQVFALATGKTQQEIAAACREAHPNHVGAAISRHKRAGRIEERDGKLYVTPPTETEQPAMV